MVHALGRVSVQDITNKSDSKARAEGDKVEAETEKEAAVVRVMTLWSIIGQFQV